MFSRSLAPLLCDAVSCRHLSMHAFGPWMQIFRLSSGGVSSISTRHSYLAETYCAGHHQSSKTLDRGASSSSEDSSGTSILIRKCNVATLRALQDPDEEVTGAWHTSVRIASHLRRHGRLSERTSDSFCAPEQPPAGNDTCKQHAFAMQEDILGQGQPAAQHSSSPLPKCDHNFPVQVHDTDPSLAMGYLRTASAESASGFAGALLPQPCTDNHPASMLSSPGPASATPTFTPPPALVPPTINPSPLSAASLDRQGSSLQRSITTTISSAASCSQVSSNSVPAVDSPQVSLPATISVGATTVPAQQGIEHQPSAAATAAAIAATSPTAAVAHQAALKETKWGSVSPVGRLKLATRRPVEPSYMRVPEIHDYVIHARRKAREDAKLARSRLSTTNGEILASIRCRPAPNTAQCSVPAGPAASALQAPSPQVQVGKVPQATPLPRLVRGGGAGPAASAQQPKHVQRPQHRGAAVQEHSSDQAVQGAYERLLVGLAEQKRRSSGCK